MERMQHMQRLLQQADFSQTTDLKKRLRSHLFPDNIVAFPQSIKPLSEAELDTVAAAGSAEIITENSHYWNSPLMDGE